MDSHDDENDGSASGLPLAHDRAPGEDDSELPVILHNRVMKPNERSSRVVAIQVDETHNTLLAAHTLVDALTSMQPVRA